MWPHRRAGRANTPPRRGRAGSGAGRFARRYRAFQRSDGITLCFDSCRSTLGNGPDRRKTGSEWVIDHRSDGCGPQPGRGALTTVS